MTYQIWLTIKELPEITDEQALVYAPFLANLSENIGNTVNSRILKRCMFTGSLEEIIQVELYLQSLGKAPVLCGVRDFEGDWIVKKNQAEFDKHFEPDLKGNIPADNTSAGWLAFNEELPIPINHLL